jgi:phage-related protein (TIGR01555 family)
MNKSSTRKITSALNELRELKNTLADLVPAQAYNTSQLSNMETLFLNNRYAPLTINRNLLSFLYSEHGIVQTAIDQPVEDALRGGIEITSQELDADDIKELQSDIKNVGSIDRLKEAEIWKRLFGGGGLIINMDVDPTQPFKHEPTKNLEFYAVDRWELTNPRGSEAYIFYGSKIHHTRVIELVGKAAPSFLKPQLQGWGMSEMERMVRDINAYFKNTNVIFELLDEAKIDVFKVKNFNNSLTTAQGTSRIQRRIDLVNQVKNYQKALVMDTNDEYEQKTMTFSGLAEMLKEVRIGIAASLRMPMTKIFGLSASGFNSGEDDIENYNAMIESEIRSKLEQPVRMIVGLHCFKLWGYAPQFDVKFKPLRIMSEKDEEDINRSRQERVLGLYDRGLLDSEESGSALSQYKLLPIQTKMEQGLLPPAPPSPAQANMQQQMGAGEGGTELPAKQPGKAQSGDKPEKPEADK